ncbi:MAG: orotidine-5'-phosphate decarboxylase [Pseudomonadota bacterium]|nr:orotidine-5'-phosphate decarboxylase [Pseudomonadota bacterium]
MKIKKKKIFIACDTTDPNKIKQIIKKTQNSKINFGYKFGLQFLNSKNGRKFVSNLKNKITFGDYKLADIPNTCVSAVKAVRDLKLNYITIHISSGLKALKAVKRVSGKTKLVGVTILTSLDNKSLKEIGFDKNLKKLVQHQARLATKAKLDAIVCSAHEIKIVRRVFKKEIITPGIRLLGDSKGDQKRVMSPKQAFYNGATALVMGRSLTDNIEKNIKKLIKDLN